MSFVLCLRPCADSHLSAGGTAQCLPLAVIDYVQGCGVLIIPKEFSIKSAVESAVLRFIYMIKKIAGVAKKVSICVWKT